MQYRSARTLVALALTTGMAFVAPVAAQAKSSVNSTTVSPTQISFSAPDLINANRGQYRWGGMSKWGTASGTLFPNSNPNLYSETKFWEGATVEYYRVPWTAVESDEGVFDFSVLDAKIAEAAARGEKFAFRVMPVDSCCSMPAADGTARLFPKYLLDKVNAWSWSNEWGEAAVIPDWNDPDYIAAVQRLLAALGERYDKDDRIAYVDLMGFGNFGEWHTYPFGDNGPNGQTMMTEENTRKIVDANFQAFPNTQIVSLTAWDATMDYIVAKYPESGFRVDCMGAATGGGAWPRMARVPESLDRWKTQPIVTEWCGSNYDDAAGVLWWTTEGGITEPSWATWSEDVGRDMYAVGRDQVQQYHISMLSSGNFQHAWNGIAMTDQQFEDWSMANKTSGYRYSVVKAKVANKASGASTIMIDATWRNAGVAPTYDKWDVEVVLLDASGKEVFSAPSKVDLNSLYADNSYAHEVPVTADVAVREKIKLPKLASGEYTVAYKVNKLVQKEGATAVMPDSYYNTPMFLAQEGRTADGAYPVGTITIR